jgi:hypothetical protein
MDKNNQVIIIQQPQAQDLEANKAEPHQNTVLNPPVNKAKSPLKSAKNPLINT